MPFSLVQYRDADRVRGVAVIHGGTRAVTVPGAVTTLSLAARACQERCSLSQVVRAHGEGADVDLGRVELLSPIDHTDPAHVWVSGTGLTHLGSAQERDRMHRTMSEKAEWSDSMKMFMMGVEGGKPLPGERGVQPEWFFKGNGTCLVAPEAALPAPDFALDAGEEPEIAGIYLISAQGMPVRLGYALGNEFSDHITERGNYLWLAHSKLRAASIGPELWVGELPGHVEGMSRIRRDGQIIWEKAFVSGEQNMSHSLANLEYHHFKYAPFRTPGDVHVHFFGTGTLSFGDGIRTQPGDVFEITATPFSLPLRNTMSIARTPLIAVNAL